MLYGTVIGSAIIRQSFQDDHAFIPRELGQRRFVDIFETVKVGRKKESRSIAIFDETAPVTPAVKSVAYINSKSSRTTYGLLEAYRRERDQNAKLNKTEV